MDEIDKDILALVQQVKDEKDKYKTALTLIRDSYGEGVDVYLYSVFANELAATALHPAITLAGVVNSAEENKLQR